MEKEIDTDVIKATQNSLGKYVKRPPLNEKLLRKPPFRFLHDIVTTVLKTTGFFEGLFDDNELISDNVKDRESKIQFLNKVISVLSLTTGETLSVKPAKIVAGHEPEKTNELLQCLALALDNKLSSHDAVQKYKDDTKPPQTAQSVTKDTTTKSTKKSNDPKQLTAKSTEKLTSRRDANVKSLTRNERIIETKSKNKETRQVKQTKGQQVKVTNQKESSSQQLKVERKVSAKTITEKSKTETKPVASHSNKINKTEPLTAGKLQDSIFDNSECFEKKKEVLPNEDLIDEYEPSIEPVITRNAQGFLDTSYTLTDNELNSSSSTHDFIEVEKNTTETDNKETDLKSTSDSFQNSAPHIDNNGFVQNKAEPINNKPDDVEPTVPVGSAHKSNVSEIISPAERTDTVSRPLSVRPSSSRPGAPRLREKLDKFISETDNVLLGKVHIIAENTQNEEEEEASLVIVEPLDNRQKSVEDQQSDSLIVQNEHGHLVQQILDSHKEFSQSSGKTEIEWQFGAQTAKEAQYQAVEQLRFNIQALSRVANPLGKLLDHIQEDVEVMRQELQQWKNIYDDVSKDISKQKTLNEDSLQPLHAKLKQLEVEVEEKNDKIGDMKILIHKNATRIEKLLASGNVQ